MSPSGTSRNQSLHAKLVDNLPFIFCIKGLGVLMGEGSFPKIAGKLINNNTSFGFGVGNPASIQRSVFDMDVASMPSIDEQLSPGPEKVQSRE